MGRKKTHEEYVAEVAAVNPNIEVIETYSGSNTKILHRCKIDDYEWYVMPNHILRNRGCPRCAGNERYGHEEYVKRVTDINLNIEVVGKYINANTKILHRCKIDGCEWYTAPYIILQNHGCPKCSGVLKKTHNEYVAEVEKINQNIEILGEYINRATPILHRCKIDGYEWYTSPDIIIRGHGCPKCNTSNGEKIIESWLKENNVLYESEKIFHDCRYVRPLPFDFYLPQYNICIEFQGKQHYESIEYFGGEERFKTQVLRDNIKKEYCRNNNIVLIEMPYYADIYEELNNLHELIIDKEVTVA